MSLLDEAMDLIRGRAKCPECKSKSVVVQQTFGLTATFQNVNLKCNSCGHTWTERSLKSISF